MQKAPGGPEVKHGGIGAGRRATGIQQAPMAAPGELPRRSPWGCRLAPWGFILPVCLAMRVLAGMVLDV